MPPEFFDNPEQAEAWLQNRGYTLTKNANWLLPAGVEAPSKKDRIAALYLSHMGDYGGIVTLARCPFCGGRADPRSNIGVECLDCGGNAPDLEVWQQRKP